MRIYYTFFLVKPNPPIDRLKRRRYQAITAKAVINPNLPKAAMASTPATNVACMKYNGGGAAETICMIDLGNDAAKKVRPTKKIKTIKGISALHYMQCEARGVRVWQVANIGDGQLVTWETIKRHHHGINVVNPCVPLIDVPAAVDPARVTTETAVPSNEFKPKIHRSHKNVKARKKECAIRLEEKRLSREHKYHQQVEYFARTVEEVKSLMCEWCSRPMTSAAALHKHQVDGCTRARGKNKKDSQTAITTSVPTDTTTSDTDTAAVAIVDDATLSMGYAWNALRAHVTEVVGTRARVILEQAFQRGVAKGGDRKSCFQMVCH